MDPNQSYTLYHTYRFTGILAKEQFEYYLDAPQFSVLWFHIVLKVLICADLENIHNELINFI